MLPAHTYRIEIKGPSSSQIEKAVMAAHKQGSAALAKEVERVWREKAQSVLDSSLTEYMDGLIVRADVDGVEATLSGWLPVALESGAQRFDMKPGLLKNRTSRVIPMHDGEFRTVSKTSPPSSWWHPGFEAYDIHEEVFKETEDMIAKAYTPAFSRIKI